MKFFARTLLFALACAGPASAAERTPIVELDHVLAVVNDDVITQSELSAEIATISAQLRQQNTALPPADILDKQVLERLILKRLQLQLASNTGIRVDDDTLNRAISTIAQQNKLSLAEFRTVLEKDGFSFPVFRERIREEIVINRLRQRQVDSRVTVTEQEVDNFLSNQQRQSAASAEEYHVAQILIALPEAASPEQIDKARQKAGEVLKKLRAGADFSETAVAVSDDQQALQGGDLGWRPASQLPTLFADLAIKMQPGETSELLRSPSGFHIIKLIEKRGETAHIVQQTLARHILIHTNEITSDSDAQTRLQQLKQRIEGGDDFAALATSHSEDPATAVNGGSLGWVGPGDVDAQFEEVMSGLKPGEVSAPFQTQFGWHIMQVLERREHDSTREFNRSKAREAIRKRKIEEQTQSWLRALRDEAYVEYKTEDE
ncbi:MAG: peptidylprolyl isomerase [Gammaproteobacteria bacterium]|nr:peptidylprolyl isomerase [Gammaproteobacteria bacterium]